jgi:hypothetical protein
LLVGIQRDAEGRLLCQISEQEDLIGPFHVIVGADGVRSQFRRRHRHREIGGKVALIGDARWVQDRWWDLGFARVTRGADMALQDGIDLAQLLLRQTQELQGSALDLGRFSAAAKQGDIAMRRIVTFLVVVLCIAIQRMLFSTSP